MRPSHDQYYLNMLELVAARSTCARRAVGAIFVDERHRVLAMGFNGVPVGLTHCIDTPCAGRFDQAGQTDRCEAVHAEVSALLTCHRPDLIHTLYVSCEPCFNCAKILCNTSLKRIVCLQPYADARGEALFLARGIELVVKTT
jgi:dCMP deaminase